MKQRFTKIAKIKRYLINKGVCVTTIGELAEACNTSRSTAGQTLQALKLDKDWKVLTKPHNARSGQALRFKIYPPPLLE